MQVLHRIALYVRVSSEAQVDGYSLDAQEAVLRREAKRRNLQVYQVFRDEGVSGFKEDRRGLNQLLQNARQGCFNEVWVWTISRVSRKLSYLLTVLEELRKTFRPEFLNRLDDIIVFHQLEEDDLAQIVSLMLKDVSRRLSELDIHIEFTENAREVLTKEGFDLNYGARPLRRAIQKTVEDRLSEEMLKGEIKKGDTVTVDVEDEQLKFKRKALTQK
jgi:predicted site-specific integrase-resolvase